MTDSAPWTGLNLLTRHEMRTRIAAGYQHYVYVLCKPDGIPFYVGKGITVRCFQHEANARNTTLKSHKLNVIRQLHERGEDVAYVYVSDFDAEASALAAERDLIRLFGRHDQKRGPLTNQTDGGEGASNPSLESKMRHLASLGGDAEDPERRVANEFLASIGGPQSSVPIKPWRTLQARAQLLRPSPGKPTPAPTARMAKAIVASARANELLLFPGVIIPRRLSIQGVECAIENGCGGDMIHAGMVEPMEPRHLPLDEKLKLTEKGFAAIINLLGRDLLIDYAVIAP